MGKNTDDRDLVGTAQAHDATPIGSVGLVLPVNPEAFLSLRFTFAAAALLRGPSGANDLASGSISLDRFEFTEVRPSQFGSGSAIMLEAESERNDFLGPTAIPRVPIIGGFPAQQIYSCDTCSGGAYYGAPYPENGVRMEFSVPSSGLYEIQTYHLSAATRQLDISINDEPLIPYAIFWELTEPAKQVLFADLRSGENSVTLYGVSIDRIIVSPPPVPLSLQ
jgi:hypothetical protein